MFDFDWQPFSINRDNFARISSSSSPSLPESIDGYHNSAINFWSGGIDGIIRNRTLIKNETMTTVWTVDELKTAINDLVNNIVKISMQYNNHSAALNQQWALELNDLLKKFNNSVGSLPNVQKNRYRQEFSEKPIIDCVGEECHGKRNGSFERFINPTFPAVKIHVITTTSSWLSRGLGSLESLLPTNLNFTDQLSQLISKIFSNLENDSSDDKSADFSGFRSVEPLVKQSVLKSIYQTVINEGEFPIPTVPTVTVYDTWPNNTWFWIWHALGVVIIIALIISIIVLCLKMRKRKQYERLT
ncbi:unnamed protein product [Dracunculus medinensis]|uniref:Uncharacterized protein n=1 Tax=Dracunculus medinensis TaxID=318479 RepID=A0A0N4ULY8_DRAME|nr:unnamed protein product [Dracunculus medinensis]